MISWLQRKGLTPADRAHRHGCAVTKRLAARYSARVGHIAGDSRFVAICDIRAQCVVPRPSTGAGRTARSSERGPPDILAMRDEVTVFNLLS